MELYIARHGETNYNAEGRIQGNGKDSALTPRGIQQAQALGKAMEGISFDAVYTSTLKRAVDTVKHAFGSKYEPILDKRLVEIGLGAIEGMLSTEAAVAYPESHKTWPDPVAYVPPPRGEALEDMIARIDAFLEDVKKTGYKKVFVLTHGYTLRIFYSCTRDKSLEAIGYAPRYDNCQVVRYLYEDKRWITRGE